MKTDTYEALISKSRNGDEALAIFKSGKQVAMNVEELQAIKEFKKLIEAQNVRISNLINANKTILEANALLGKSIEMLNKKIAYLEAKGDVK